MNLHSLDFVHNSLSPPSMFGKCEFDAEFICCETNIILLQAVPLSNSFHKNLSVCSFLHSWTWNTGSELVILGSSALKSDPRWDRALKVLKPSNQISESSKKKALNILKPNSNCWRFWSLCWHHVLSENNQPCQIIRFQSTPQEKRPNSRIICRFMSFSLGLGLGPTKDLWCHKSGSTHPPGLLFAC